ncbi:regulator of MON1-CCZ1 complex-like [Littorina saxatilis]|uniref:Mic1 domain-containing protein n=1 Tax=Littorina saxatilis TaxID=31220 RepID=A0AAN9B6C8_9CAEN
MASGEDSQHYVELCTNPIRFEPVSKANNVFFDDANKQVFAVRGKGAMGIVVKGPDEKAIASFRTDDKEDVVSIKFSPDKRILAIQRTPRAVEFVNFKEDMTSEQQEYSHPCKAKCDLLGFVWTGFNEVVYITAKGIEQYQVQPEKKSLKMVKSVSLDIRWYFWLSSSGFLLLSSGATGNILHPIMFKVGVMTRLAKFEVDLPLLPRPHKPMLHERDVIMAVIYEYLYVIVLKHPPNAAAGAEIVMYQVQKEGPARKTDVLKLDMSGRFAINVVDSLVIVHHQASKTSVIFDIKLEGKSDGFVKSHYPVLSPLPIKPFKLLLPSVNMQAGTDKTEFCCELYSANWVVFQPDIIIDAKLGCLWSLGLNLVPIVAMLPDKVKLIQFLLNRGESKSVLLSVCRQMLTPGQQTNLVVISQVYDMLNQVYKAYLETEAHMMSMDSAAASSGPRSKVVIDQSDMFTHVFSVFEEHKDIPYKFMVAVLIEYIRSLNHFAIPVQHFLYELIINILVHNNCFYQLHQFLQYHVLGDSKPLACLMLSLESVYPPAHQLALDMLKRLQTANEEIIEVLLSKCQLLPALRFIRSVGIVDMVSSRKFLEAAQNTEDNLLFYTVFKFFEQRNQKLKGNPRFQPGEHCEEYVQKFGTLFGTDALMMVPVNQ